MRVQFVVEAMLLGVAGGVTGLLAGIGIAFIIYYGGKGVINGTNTPGTLISFIAAVILLYDPVKKLSRVHNVIQEGLAAAERRRRPRGQDRPA